MQPPTSGPRRDPNDDPLGKILDSSENAAVDYEALIASLDNDIKALDSLVESYEREAGEAEMLEGFEESLRRAVETRDRARVDAALVRIESQLNASFSGKDLESHLAYLARLRERLAHADL